MNLKNKRVTVVGLGNSGVNAAILLNSLGAFVKATDESDSSSARETSAKLKEKGIKVETGRHTQGFVKGSDLVVVSPGVEDSSLPVKWAKESGIPVIGEMELGFNFCKGKIIAITGTNGKSTVTTLIGKILKDGGKTVVVCGNIGNSLCGEIARIKKDTYVVLEVSSFQLEKIKHFKPHIALILNITDDHMDRYEKFSDYFKEKLKVFENQDKDDVLILNGDAGNLKELKDKARARVLFYSRLNRTGASYIKDGHIFCAANGVEKEICPVSDIRLKGVHNVENVLASVLVGDLAGVSQASMRDTIEEFKGLHHRFETVATIDGVEYIDDSKGTTVDSTRRALESCRRPVILIAGGKDKHSDYSAARDIVKRKVKTLVLIGEASGAIKKGMRDVVNVREAKDMFEAVAIAHSMAKDDYIVLLSPMCSSFDMFKDYKERGEIFKKAVYGVKDYSEKVKA